MVLNVMGTLSSMITTARKWGYVAEPVKLSELALPAEGVKVEARFSSAAAVMTFFGGEYRTFD
jgi:hypothetical protein